MKWTKYTIKTTTKDADMVSAILADHGICDVQIENNVPLTDEELNQMYADLVKELPPDDGSCDVSFYVEFRDGEADTARMEETLRALEEDLKEAEMLFGIAPVSLVCEDLNSEDWENNWKAYFRPFAVDNMLIVPTWEKVPEVIIRIDPGMAFGTGTHETTRLCLRALGKDLKKGDAVLDLGCGSGILGIAARKLGAASVVSVDIDETAVKTAKENFGINEVLDDKSLFYTGNVTNDEALKETLLAAGKGGFDIVTVNILADVIAVMMPGLGRYLKKEGILITSGILREKEELIRTAMEANPELEFVDVAYDGDWVSITARKR